MAADTTKLFLIDFECASCATKAKDSYSKPVEVAILEMTVRDGVLREFHRFIHPGELNAWETKMAESVRETIHGIPHKDFPKAVQDIKCLWADMVEFIYPYDLNNSWEPIPRLYAKGCNTENSCIRWIAKEADARNPFAPVAEIEDFMAEVTGRNTVNGPPMSAKERKEQKRENARYSRNRKDYKKWKKYEHSKYGKGSYGNGDDDDDDDDQHGVSSNSKGGSSNRNAVDENGGHDNEDDEDDDGAPASQRRKSLKENNGSRGQVEQDPANGEQSEKNQKYVKRMEKLGERFAHLSDEESDGVPTHWMARESNYVLSPEKEQAIVDGIYDFDDWGPIRFHDRVFSKPDRSCEYHRALVPPEGVSYHCALDDIRRYCFTLCRQLRPFFKLPLQSEKEAAGFIPPLIIESSPNRIHKNLSRPTPNRKTNTTSWQIEHGVENMKVGRPSSSSWE